MVSPVPTHDFPLALVPGTFSDFAPPTPAYISELIIKSKTSSCHLERSYCFTLKLCTCYFIVYFISRFPTSRY